MSGLRSQLRGKHVVLTGVTGFVAKVWLAMVLEQVPEVGRITLVIRPRGKKKARTRFEQIVNRSPCFRSLRAAHGADLGRFMAQRVRVLDGDIERPLFGLASDELSALTGNVDLLLHCAGITDFQPDPLKALRINVFGARHAAILARKLGAPLLHVSTCFVAGEADGPVPESIEPGVSPNGTRFEVNDEIRRLQQVCRDAGDNVTARTDAAAERALELGWPNLYTFTKGLAEHVVVGTRGVDSTIVRPAIVECARNFPFEGWNEGLNTAGPLAWLITTAFRRLPTRPEHRFDVVPVDDVARGLSIVAARICAGEGGGVVQLASSDSNPLTFGRTVELTGLGMRRWVRKGGGTDWDRTVTRYLDPIPVAQDKPGFFSVDRLHRWAGHVRDTLGRVDDAADLPDWLGEDVADRLASWARRTRSQATDAQASLQQVRNMLVLFKPFIHDYDYVFHTDRIRQWADSEDPAFAWEVPQIDWRHYWVDVEFPGLQTWSIPAIRGESIPQDPPMRPPFRLPHVPLDERAASK